MLYSGYYRDHGLKHQFLSSPDGLIINLPPPFVGSTHDSTMLDESGLVGELRAAIQYHGRHFAMYADQVYALSEYCITGFRRRDPHVTQAQKDWTALLNRPRTSVEWTIGKLASTCALTTDNKQQKVQLQNLGMVFSVAALITNCHTCCYGGVPNQYFDTVAPELEDYMDV